MYLFYIDKLIMHIKRPEKEAMKRINIGENINSLLFIVHFIIDFMCS
jgi:hypothetical protein